MSLEPILDRPVDHLLSYPRVDHPIQPFPLVRVVEHDVANGSAIQANPIVERHAVWAKVVHYQLVP